MAITTSNGKTIGTICVVDDAERAWNDDDVSFLRGISATLVDQLELTHRLKVQSQTESVLLADMVDMNHELRTPLQTIIGFSEFLKTETRRDLINAHVHTIQTASESVLSIINQTLDQVAGLNRGKMTNAPVEIRALAEAAIRMVGPLAAQKRLDSRLIIREGVPRVAVFDRQRVLQALLNLLQNAAKFTTRGGFSLDIARVGGGLRFSVSDTGIGIANDKVDQLFQRFSRIEPEHRQIQGTGLGLAITKALVETLEGRIGVMPNTHGGTTFWFEIPNAPEGTLEPAQTSGRHETLDTIRILIADDLDLNRKLIADMLAIDGHMVDCVADGADAVNAARETVYDLILMDMIMPGMDGPTAARAIRALPAPACNVPILALTANCGKEQLESCLAAGMNATLVKPMTFEDLSTAVTTWVSRRSEAA